MLQIGNAQIDLTPIVLAVITLIFGLISRYAIPYAKSKLNGNQLEMLRIAVKTAVYAAEQIYGSKQGQEKLRYVIDLLFQQGYILDPDKVSDTTKALIEAIVKELSLEQEKNLPAPEQAQTPEK